MTDKPIIHGRDHEHGSADPTQVHYEDVGGSGGGGSGGGIDFDTYPQAGQWLYVETDGPDTSPSGFGVEIYDQSPNGINIATSSGGDATLDVIGGGRARIHSSAGIDINEDAPSHGHGIVIQSLRSHVTIIVSGNVGGNLSYLILAGLPTSDPGVSGAVWNNSGVLSISP